MPPANNSFATATTIPSFPYDFTQLDINDGGVNFTVYYRFIAPANSRVIGVWGFSGNIGAGYRPTVFPYNGPAGAPTSVLFVGNQNRPIQFPVVPGNEYFLEFVKNIDTAGPEDLRIQAEVAPLNNIARGNIMVNDDTPGYPLVILSHLTDYLVINFVKDVAAGEAGDILLGGVIALNNFSDNTIKVYNSAVSQITSFSEPVSGDPRIRACRGANKFYLGMSRTPPAIYTISSAGVLSALKATLTANTNLFGIAAANDESILYFSNVSAGGAIKRWNLNTDTAMTDLVAGIAGYFAVDILVLADGTIVVLFDNSGTQDVSVRRYDSAGALLNTYPMGTHRHPAGTFARLAYAVDDPASIWVWMHPSGAETGISRFINIRVSDGATLVTRNHAEYELGNYEPAETATPLSRFGNSFSCPFFLMPLSVGPSGVYVVVPNKTSDTTDDGAGGTQNVAIPNPTFKTALLP